MVVPMGVCVAEQDQAGCASRGCDFDTRRQVTTSTPAIDDYSHRVYGKDAAGPMGDWLQANESAMEKTLMAWDKIPAPAALRQLPQRK